MIYNIIYFLCDGFSKINQNSEPLVWSHTCFQSHSYFYYYFLGACLRQGGVGCLYFDLFVELLSQYHLLNGPLIYFLPLDNFDKQKKSLLQRQDLNGENIFTEGEIGKELVQELVNHGANVNYYPSEEITTLIYCDCPSSAQNKGLSVYLWISRSKQMLKISLSKKRKWKINEWTKITKEYNIKLVVLQDKIIRISSLIDMILRR